MATAPTIKTEPPLSTTLSPATLSPPTLSYSLYTTIPESFKNADLQSQNHNDPNIMSGSSPSLGTSGMEGANVNASIPMEPHAYNQMIGDYQQLSPQQPNTGAHTGLASYGNSWPATTTAVMLSDTYAVFPQSNHPSVLYSPTQPSPTSAAATNQTTTSPSLRPNQTQSQPHQSPVPSHSSPQLSTQSIHQQQPSPTPTIALSPTGFMDASSHNEHLLCAQNKQENGTLSGHASPGHEDLHVGAPSPASPVSSPPEGIPYFQMPISMYNPNYTNYASM
jgi:hypothetical protein